MRRTFLIGIVLAIFVGIGIFISSEHLPDGMRVAMQVATSSTPAITLASFSDSYHRGVHTLSGALITPTPCYIVVTQSTLVPSTTPPLIQLNLSIPQDTGRCLDLPATTTFRVTQHSARDSVVNVYLNGILATSTGTTTISK